MAADVPTPSMRAPATYRICVGGRVEPDALAWLADFEVEPGEHTVLVGRVEDQAALSGLLNALYDHQLPVVSVECIGPAPSPTHDQAPE